MWMFSGFMSLIKIDVYEIHRESSYSSENSILLPQIIRHTFGPSGDLKNKLPPRFQEYSRKFHIQSFKTPHLLSLLETLTIHLFWVFLEILKTPKNPTLGSAKNLEAPPIYPHLYPSIILKNLRPSGSKSPTNLWFGHSRDLKNAFSPELPKTPNNPRRRSPSRI